MINVLDRAFLQLIWYPEKLSYFFSAMTVLVLSSFGMKLLGHHYKLTTERNRHSVEYGPLRSGPIGLGSGYYVTPVFTPYT